MSGKILQLVKKVQVRKWVEKNVDFEVRKWVQKIKITAKIIGWKTGIKSLNQKTGGVSFLKFQNICEYYTKFSPKCVENLF